MDAVACLEELEIRRLLAAPPTVTAAFADNRGQVVLRFDRAMNAETFTSRSVKILTSRANKDRAVPVTLSYSSKQRRLTVRADIKPDTPYKLKLISKYIKDATGSRLDGEFNGQASPSGDGKAGGDYLAMTRVQQQPVARFYTVLGDIDVRLFAQQTPLTVQNFLRYANAYGKAGGYSYDNTFIHRSVKGFVIQGGGYRVNQENELEAIQQWAAIPNEPHPNDPGNIRGTIAMAKLGGLPNSATNQWFFNLADNRANLDYQNGGFTVFGQITNAAGLKVMDRIAALKVFNLGSPFSETPIVDADAAIARGQLDPGADLVLVRRVAVLVDLVSTATSKASGSPGPNPLPHSDKAADTSCDIVALRRCFGQTARRLQVPNSLLNQGAPADLDAF